MARGTAHAPKPEGQRRRRNAPAVGERELVRTHPVEVLSIQDATGLSDWSTQTAAWWRVWTNSPQAAVFEQTDWLRLTMLAPLVEQFWLNGGDVKLLAEIRQNEERLGATYTDRQRARMRVVAPADAPAQPGLASVSSLDARRAEWLSEVDDDD